MPEQFGQQIELEITLSIKLKHNSLFCIENFAKFVDVFK